MDNYTLYYKSMEELREIAKSKHLVGYSKLNKDELVGLIRRGVRQTKYVSPLGPNEYNRKFVKGIGAPFESFDITTHKIFIHDLLGYGYMIQGVNLNGRYNSTYVPMFDSGPYKGLGGWHIPTTADYEIFCEWKHTLYYKKVKSLFHCAADVVNSKKITDKDLSRWIPVAIVRKARFYRKLLI